MNGQRFISIVSVLPSIIIHNGKVQVFIRSLKFFVQSCLTVANKLYYIQLSSLPGFQIVGTNYCKHFACTKNASHKASNRAMYGKKRNSCQKNALPRSERVAYAPDLYPILHLREKIMFSFAFFAHYTYCSLECNRFVE